MGIPLFMVPQIVEASKSEFEPILPTISIKISNKEVFTLLLLIPLRTFSVPEKVSDVVKWYCKFSIIFIPFDVVSRVL